MQNKEELFFLRPDRFEISHELVNCQLLESSNSIEAFSKEPEVFIFLFCGWYGKDVKALNFLLRESLNFPFSKIRIKNYLNENEMYNFNEALIPEKFSPCILSLNDNQKTYINQGIEVSRDIIVEHLGYGNA